MADDELSLLIKPVSADCNMQCTYCFYRRPGDPYRSETQHMMDDTTLRTMIARYMRSAGRSASFGWQGGEPLLAGIDFFRQVVEYQQLYGRSGQLVGNNLQTNGLLIDEEWAQFFRQYNFFVGVSLDGPEKDHDRYRYSAGGAGGFRQTMRGIEILRDHRVDFSILAVVNAATAKKAAELYEFFTDKGFTRLQFIPCVEWEPDSGRAQGFSVGVEDYRDFLCTLFDAWYNDGRPVVSVRLFENILALYMGREAELCAYKNRCGSYVVVEYNGDVYPCDFFVEGQWLLGNIGSMSIGDMMKKRKRRVFNDHKMVQVSGCTACEWNFLCHFGCQHYRSAAGENYLCSAYREFFRYTRLRFYALAERIAQMPTEWARI